jgi:TolB-like protein/Flp pilus assembly protein TadD
MSGETFAFGPFILNPGGGTLTRGGVAVPLSYRGLRVLTALALRPGAAMTKSDLIDVAWDGAIVEEGNLAVQVAALRKLMGPAPDGADWIATVPRVGYRFAGALETHARAEQGSPREPGPSIAVLAFTNLSGDVEQEFFADGLAEDIITRLSRVRGLFVTARNSSFTYKGKPVSVKQVGSDLGVRYVLEGSVRSSGQRTRIAAQLIDAFTERQVWAERYDVEIADFLALQDQIAESVTAAIEPRLYAAEHSRLSHRATENLDAWGLVMRAMPYVWTWGSADDIYIAQIRLRQALQVAPDYSRANSLLAWTQAARVQLGWSESREELESALTLARKAIASDPEDAWAHLAAGYAHMVGRETDIAIEELGEAIALNSSLALAHVILGSTYGYGGMPVDGLHELAVAARLSPRDYTQAGNLATVGLCHLIAGRFREAVDAELRAVQLRPHFGTAWRTLTAAAGLAGDSDTGRRALAETTRLHPAISIDWVERFHPIVRPADRALYVEGLRASGLR